jgi:predicted DNA binding protein
VEDLIGPVELRWYGVLDGELISLDAPGAAPITLPETSETHALHQQLAAPPVDVFRLGDRFAVTVRTDALSEEDRERLRGLAAAIAEIRSVSPAPQPRESRDDAAKGGELQLLERLSTAVTVDALYDRLINDCSALPWVQAVAVGAPTTGDETLTLHGHVPFDAIEDDHDITDPIFAAVAADSGIVTRSLDHGATSTGVRRWARGAGATQLWAVPLCSGPIIHGVLVCGVDRPPSTARSLLSAVGTVAGGNIQAHLQANASMADGDRDLVIRYPELDGPMRTLAAELDTELVLPQLTITQPHVVVVFAQVAGTSVAAIEEAAASVGAITEVRPVLDGADPLVAMHVVDPGFHAAVRTLGPYIQAITVTATAETVRYRLPPSMPQRELLRQIEAVVGSGEIQAVGAGEPTPRLPWTQVLRARLTDQQLQILASAYHAGYFSAERPMTGTELAALLGMAQPTFSTHLRAGLQRLLSGVFAETADPLADVIRKKE